MEHDYEVIVIGGGAAGLSAADYSGHSLRSGFLTAAARAGASIWKMQEVSRHKSVQVLSGYVRSTELFDDHAGTVLRSAPSWAAMPEMEAPAACSRVAS